MLAYVFWHTPAQGVALESYERALSDFHRSLARTPPFGFQGSVVFRVDALPWSGAGAGAALTPGAGAALTSGEASAAATSAPTEAQKYEDWYLVEDFAALGVLNEAAVARGHRTSHDRAAKGLGNGSAGLYRLIEGEQPSARSLARCAHATWVTPAPGAGRAELAAMLGDGADPRGTSVWQRQLVLGPAPEFCVLSREDPAGVAPTRLAPRWSARTDAREAAFGA